MRYLIHDGGNKLQLPWSVQTSGRVGNYRVNYAEHHKRRTLEIEKHIDTQSYVWNGFDYSIHGESDDKPIVLASGDELVTHLIGAGTLIDYVVFHVKREGSGTIEPFIELDDGSRFPVLNTSGSQLTIDLSETGHYYGVVPAPAAVQVVSAVSLDETAVAAAAADGVTSVPVTLTLADFKVDGKTVSGVTATGTVDVPRGASAEGAGNGLPAPLLAEDNGVLGFAFTAEKDDDSKDMAFDTCIGIYLSLKDFWDEHQCECAPAPCETEYPDAVCAPNKKPAGKGA